MVARHKTPLTLLALAAMVIAAIIGGFSLGGSQGPQGSFASDATGIDDRLLVSPISADGVVAPDPNFQEALKAGRFSTRGWDTDFSLHIVPYSDIFSGGPGKDGIPAIDKPQFTTPEDAADWLGSREPVIFFEINGDARAYPLQILIWHEIANDVVGSVPVTVTFCPLCNSALVFDRRLDGQVLDFGVSGNLRFSDLIMFDRQTETWWQQFTGDAIVGSLTGKALTALPASIISFEDFVASNPDGKVLSRKTGFNRSYGSNPYAGYDQIDSNPYAGYDQIDSNPFLFRGELNGQLLPKERVSAITIGEEDAAFPFTILKREKVVNYTVGGTDVAVFLTEGTLSALDRSSIDKSRDIGATGVFEAELDGRTLTFRSEQDLIVDNETGSVWNILGRATEGPLAGAQLTPIVHGDHFWFAWAAFKPDTKVYQGAS